ncbi:glycosyltransferase family 4 protein [Hyphococcus lacteus]|uniref:Glycosyltransferase family 4 protein n=1 Tax=Hyphococcus lacteus TaxID=3143536 RepID=A0ABV3Z801_9PROT
MTRIKFKTHGKGQKTDLTALLHIIPSFAFGGQQARLATLIDGLGAEFSHHIVALDGDHSARGLVSENANVAYSSFAMKKSSGISLTNIRGLMGVIKKCKPVIVCTYNWGSIEAVIANRAGPNIPNLHFEDGFGPDEKIDQQSNKRVLGRRFLLRQSMVIVPSHGLERAAREQWKLKNVRRVENGIDLARFDRPRPTGERVNIGSLGSLRPEKNYSRLITAFRALESSFDAQLVIVGEGTERQSLAARIGDTSNIMLPGATSSPADAIATFDLFALSSDTEQAPISLMEAMAAGLPVVSTDVGDIREMVSDENKPYITALGDEHAYHAAMEALIESPALRKTIGLANQQKARSTFSRDQMINRYTEIFSEIVAR